jgi:beta-glucosidase
VVVAGLDWRLEGEHIHPGDIAPILKQIPPPDGLWRSPAWPRLRAHWQRCAGLIAWFTSHASAAEGGAFAAGDRTTLHLPPEQVALIRAVAAANPRTVVVLMGGGAILTREWDGEVAGLLLLWYPGEQGGHALADVLFGRVSPSGRLPFAIPVHEDQLPPFAPRAEQVTYDLWHGYRRLSRHGQAAAWPFGFGLSYSAFAHSDAAVVPHSGTVEAHDDARDAAGDDSRDDACKGAREDGWVELAVTVRNSGAVAAAEVVQVYLEPPGERLERPMRSLVAFQRLHLGPGASRRLHLTIPLRRLACFDSDRDAFVLEAGAHRLVVAPHAEAPGLAVALELEARVLGP